MTEIAHTQKLFSDLYNGHPWIDVTIVDTLSSLDETIANKKLSAHHNSIWEIVNHMISWRENVLERINGAVLKTPASNYFEAVNDTSPGAWKQTVERFARTQQAWLERLGSMQATEFEKKYSGSEMSYYEHIHGIMQHDAYHMGQIVMLMRMLK